TRLHVEHLAHEITRRATSDPRHRSHAFERRTMACAARHRLARATRRHERLALLDRANWHVGDEPGPRVAQDLRALRLLGRLDDAHADRLLTRFGALERNPDAAAADDL